MFAFFLQKIVRDIAAAKRKCDHHWRAYKSEYAGYVHYPKSMDKMMQRRDEVNITLGVVKRLEFDPSDGDDKLMAMEIPPSKKSKNN